MVREGKERYVVTVERQARRRKETAKKQRARLIYNGPAVNLKFLCVIFFPPLTFNINTFK